MGYGYWDQYVYVSKAEKIKRSDKARAKLIEENKKTGIPIEPIILTGTQLAKTWWSKSWVKNLERYADYLNRLPRGRSYVRYGSVLDLKISENAICAIVIGSESKPYTIQISIASLNKAKESSLMAKSKAALYSMQTLLSGKFPESLKDSFFDKEVGLFPSFQEISFKCSCPDSASMCKHVAAAMYGIGVRLDEKPELFFVLRGIKIDQFIGKMVKKANKEMIKKSKKITAHLL